MTSLAIYDDVEQARNFMRPYLALYIGGMGSRDKNFYNQLVTRYGYGDAAREVQDLYLVRQAGRGDGGDPRRADRQGRAVRDRRRRSGSGSAPTATPASARCW